MQINQAHLHLMLNHIPVIGSMAVALLLFCGLIGKSRGMVTAGLAGMIIIALVSVLVFQSGEGAEEMVEDSAHVSHDYIEAHEEIAQTAYYFLLICGAVAIGLLFSGRGRQLYPAWASVTALLLAAGAVGLMTITASLGGKISHPEIREDGLLPWAGSWMPEVGGEESESGGEAEDGEHESEDDDSGHGRNRGRGDD